MPFGISPARFFNVTAIAIAVVCLGAFLYQVQQSGANKERVKNLTDKVTELEGALKSERALREADQVVIRERNAKIETINRSHAAKLVELEDELNRARHSDECVDKYIPQHVQEEIFGS